MSRITLDLDHDDAVYIVVALRLRSNQLHTLADECIARDPGGKGWIYYRQKGNELNALSDRIFGVNGPKTDVSELISPPSSSHDPLPV